jgi:hypothetical protein
MRDARRTDAKRSEENGDGGGEQRAAHGGFEQDLHISALSSLSWRRADALAH